MSKSLSTKAAKGREVELIFLSSPSTLLGQFMVGKKKKKRWGACSSKNLSKSLMKKKADKIQGKAFTKNEGKKENMVVKSLNQSLFSKRRASLK